MFVDSQVRTCAILLVQSDDRASKLASYASYLCRRCSVSRNAKLLEESVGEQRSTSVVLDLAKNIFEKIDEPVEVGATVADLPFSLSRSEH